MALLIIFLSKYLSLKREQKLELIKERIYDTLKERKLYRLQEEHQRKIWLISSRILRFYYILEKTKFLVCWDSWNISTNFDYTAKCVLLKPSEILVRMSATCEDDEE